MQSVNKYEFMLPLVQELWEREIYAAHLRDAILPGAPPGAWVYQLFVEKGGNVSPIGHIVIHEFLGIPGSLNCIYLYDDCTSPDIPKVRTAISRALDVLQYSGAPE